MKIEDLQNFLFGESQVQDEFESLPADLATFFEELNRVEQLKPKKEPLTKALSELGASTEGLYEDPDGFCFATDDSKAYRSIFDKVFSYDGMHALAQQGWVPIDIGQDSRQSEVPNYRIRFLEITDVESGSDEEKPEDLEKILKSAREFATEPMDRPKAKVPKFTKPGKPTDGSAPGSVKEDSGEEMETDVKPDTDEKKKKKLPPWLQKKGKTEESAVTKARQILGDTLENDIDNAVSEARNRHVYKGVPPADPKPKSRRRRSPPRMKRAINAKSE
jgi:hypothetical protein